MSVRCVGQWSVHGAERGAAGECFVHRWVCAAQGSAPCTGQSVEQQECFVHRWVCAVQGSAPCTGQVVEQQQESALCTDQSALRTAVLRAQGRSWRAVGECSVHRSEYAAQGSVPCTGQSEEQQESASCTDECALRRAVRGAAGVLRAQIRVRCAGQCSVHGTERGAAGVLRAQIRVRCAGQCSVHRAGRGAAAGERFVHRSECAAQGSAPCTGQVVEQQQESASCTDECAMRRAVVRARGRARSSRRVLRAQMGVRCAGQCSVHRAERGAAGVLRAQMGVRCAGQCSVHRAGRGAAAGERFVHRSECAAHGSAPCTGQVVESSGRVFRAQVRVCCAGQCSVHRAERGAAGERFVHR
ncbi:hypothetical protein NDU88_001956 [Pleurodeles waltl]|uniref:Uncharacterized protein n=1 Tax=Pleurodeles waltl TaxID=8319 RepID=A0AAV7Q7J6_PLEWA|nr:hypothetical protein NDU88_001956 [Pleurodeles waltl]